MKKLIFRDRMLSNLNSILLILFGVIALLFPSITLAAMAIFFAVFVLIGGLALMISSIRLRSINPYWYLQLFEGIVGILLGIVILAKPVFTAAILVTIIGIWAILLGLIFLFAYFRRSLSAIDKSFIIATGILSLLFGLLIIINPFESSRAIVILIGVYVIAYGVFSIINTAKIHS